MRQFKKKKKGGRGADRGNYKLI